MSTVSVSKKIPAGIPTVVFTTGANETASLKMALFGQPSASSADIKIIESSYSIPADRFTASNFTKNDLTPAVPTTANYAERTENGTTYKYFAWYGYDYLNGVYRNQLVKFDSSTYAASSFTPSSSVYRETDIQNNLVLKDYSGQSSSFALYNTGSGYFANTGIRKENTNAKTYYGYGAGIISYTGQAFTMSSSGYISVVNDFSTSTTWTDYTGQYDSPYGIVVGTGYQVYPRLAWAYNGYGYAAGINSGGYIHWARSAYNNFTSWSYQGSNGFMSGGAIDTVNGQNYTLNNFASPDYIVESGGKFIVPGYMTSGHYRLFIVAGDMSTFTLVGNATQAGGHEFQMTEKPIPVSGGFLYKKRDQSYVVVDTSGNVTPYSSPLVTVSTNALPNYAAYSQYKLNKITPPGALAFPSSANYSTNGTKFFGYDGVYTLAEDPTLTKLNAVGTEDQWFEKSVAAASGARITYSGVTLSGGKSVWITSPTDLYVSISGFKE